MILRRYGSKVSSVAPNFDSRAMTEVGFTRDGQVSIETAEFEAGWERVAGHELTAQARGDVQGDVEDAVLESLNRQLNELLASLANGQALYIENATGVDQPKTRGRQNTVVVEAENRLVFEYTIDPPLRVAVMQPK